jgi:hypothetical protein
MRNAVAFANNDIAMIAWSDGKSSPDSYLRSTPNEWLSWYFDDKGNIKTAQLKFWMRATV